MILFPSMTCGRPRFPVSIDGGVRASWWRWLAIRVAERRDDAHSEAAPVSSSVFEGVDGDVRQIWTALGRLPSEEREVLILQVREGLSIQEIAAQWKLAPSEVCHRLVSARHKIRSWCGEDITGDPAQ